MLVKMSFKFAKTVKFVSCCNGTILRRHMCILSKKTETPPTEIGMPPSLKGDYEKFNTLFPKSLRDDYAKFNTLFPEFVEDVLNLYQDSPTLASRMKEVLEYNVPLGNQARARCFMQCSRILMPNMDTDQSLEMYKVAWILEVLQAGLLVGDDIIDESETRRQKISWYKKVGSIAVNDTLLLTMLLPQVLMKRYVGTRSYFSDMYDTLNINTEISMGQYLDHYWAQPGMHNRITTDDICIIFCLKSGTSGPRISLNLALDMAGFPEVKYDKTCIELTNLFGIVLQLSNDYVNMYDCEKSRKAKSLEDIRDGQATWFFTTAMEKASEADRKILLENYGRDNDECVNAVLAIYNKVNIPELFHNYISEKKKFYFEKVEKTFQNDRIKKSLCTSFDYCTKDMWYIERKYK